MTTPFTLLRRAFLRRFLDNELLSFGADAGPQAVIWLVALGVAPGILLPFGWIAQYTWAFFQPPEVLQAMRWGHAVQLFQLSMVSTGLATALVWDALLLDRRDALVLSPLPISWRTVGVAKIAALLTAWAGFALVVNVPPAWIFASVSMRNGLWNFAGFFATHLAAALTASAFVFGTLVALQALLLNTLSATAFRRMVTAVQALAFCGALTFILIRPSATPGLWPAQLAQGSTLLWFPPIWFLGMAETWRGTQLVGFVHAGRLALAALDLSLAIAGVGFAAGFQRHVRRSVESPEMAVRGAAGRLTRLARRLAHALITQPIERATFDFILRSLARSARHRLLIGGAAGIGVATTLPGLVALVAALIDGGASGAPPLTIAVLVVPLAQSFLLLVALRISFRLPTDVGAAWVVRLTERGDAAIYLAGARKAMFVVGILPVVLLVTPLVAWIWGPIVALQQALFCTLLGLVLMNVLLGRFRSLPFTVTAIGTVDPRPARWPLFAGGFFLYTFTTAGIEQRLLARPWAFALACGLLVLAIVVDAWRRRRPHEGPTGLVFDLEPEDASVALNLATSPRA